MFTTQTVCVIDIYHVLVYNVNVVEAMGNSQRELYLQLGKRIREARKGAGLTQAELASLISLSRTSVTNIELGRQHILLHTLYDMASALGREVTDLMPEMKPESREDLTERIPDGLDEREREWIESLVSTTKGGE